MPPTIPDQPNGSPLITNPTPDYSLYAPGMKGNYALTPPGEPSLTAYLKSHQSDIEAITSGIISITGQILDGVADLDVKTAGSRNALAQASLRRAKANYEIVRVLNLKMQEADSLQRTAQRLLNEVPQEQKPMYQLASQYNASNKAAIEKQLRNQINAIVEDLNRSEKAAAEASEAASRAKVMSNVSKGLNVLGYALAFKDILTKYYAAVTECTQEAQSKFTESILSFGINLALGTIGGAAAGATYGAVGGAWGVVAGAVVCGIFAFLDYIVVAVTDKSIARHFMDFCEFVGYWGDVAATKAAEKIAPIVKPTLMDWIHWEIGDFRDIIPIRF